LRWASPPIRAAVIEKGNAIHPPPKTAVTALHWTAKDAGCGDLMTRALPQAAIAFGPPIVTEMDMYDYWCTALRRRWFDCRYGNLIINLFE